MNLNNFTIKAAETMQRAQQVAFNNKNPNIETEHILKALLDIEGWKKLKGQTLSDEEKSILKYLFDKG